VVILVKANFNFMMGFFEDWKPRTARYCFCPLAQGNSFKKKGPAEKSQTYHEMGTLPGKKDPWGLQEYARSLMATTTQPRSQESEIPKFNFGP